MGYDLTVRFDSRKTRDDMWAFVQEQSSSFQQFSKALGLQAWSPALACGEDLGGYVPDARNRRLGFHVAIADEWQWAILVWLAQKGGDRDRDGNLSVWCDKERWALRPSHVPAQGDESTVEVDERGRFQFPARLTDVLLSFGTRSRARRAVTALLDSLDEAWAARPAVSPEVSPNAPPPLRRRKGP
jgi:hypothetical protein